MKKFSTGDLIKTMDNPKTLGLILSINNKIANIKWLHHKNVKPVDDYVNINKLQLVESIESRIKYLNLKK